MEKKESRPKIGEEGEVEGVEKKMSVRRKGSRRDGVKVRVLDMIGRRGCGRLRRLGFAGEGGDGGGWEDE